MKKSLLLIALLVISVSAYAAAPNFADIPDLKFLVGEGLSAAFDLECFNTGDAATSYNINTNFLGLSILSASWVGENPYGSATTGGNVYAASNDGGTGTASNKVKWSTYRINKLPKVGLSVGASATVDLTSYVASIPPSFGSPGALSVSDAAVSAVWNGTSKVDITLNSAASGPVYVYVIAAPDATPGIDQDKEAIAVYTNLLTVGSGFASGSDTTSWGFENAVGKSSRMAVSQVASATDGAGVAGSGVLVLTATDNTGGIKFTNLAGAVPYSAGQWYITRAKYFASGAAVTGTQFQVWNYSNNVDGLHHIDASANITYKLSTTWKWLESPLYSNSSGNGYPQIQAKASGAVVINIDEVQLLNAAPALLDARGCDNYGYAAGDFNSGSDSTGWVTEAYNGSVPLNTSATIAGGVLGITFSSSVSGLKMTAATGPGAVVTPASPAIGKDVGVKANVNFLSGGFTNAAGIFVEYIFGVSTNGGLDFFTDGQLAGAAEFIGGVSNGTHYAVFPAEKPYNQFQFAIKGSEAASVQIDNVDFISDKDDPYMGDGSLFPL